LVRRNLSQKRNPLYQIHQGFTRSTVTLVSGANSGSAIHPPDARPLYLGKAEDSLISRDLRTHFGDGRTGQSTVRRSLAALLHDALGVRGMPRNPANPAYFANYGLSREHDTVLTRWMKERLLLAVWPKATECMFDLGTIEKALLAELMPPLNVKDVMTPWTAQVKAARAVMAAEARAWVEEQ
jgi:hypothetical protein